MSSFLNKLSKQIFRDRIKPFIFIYIVLIIAYFIIGHYGLKDNSVNYFYIGLGQIILAGFWFMLAIEHILLKKKKFAIFYFVPFLMFIYLAIHSFDLLNIKR